MATLNFPSDPGGVGPSTYTANGITYDWTGVYWKARVDNVGVDQIVAGTNVTIDPAGGEGVVTINSTGGSGGGGAEVYVNVKDFGAVGDGTTDDSDAIQSAIDSGAKTIFFPDGDYLVDKPINIYAPTSSPALNLKGAAKDGTKIISNFYGADKYLFNGYGDGRCREVSFYDMEIRSQSRSGGVNPCYIGIGGWGNSTLANVKLSLNNNVAICCASVQNLRAYNVDFYYCGKSYVYKDTDSLTGNYTAATKTLVVSADTFDANDAGKYVTIKTAVKSFMLRIDTVTDARTVVMRDNTVTGNFAATEIYLSRARVSVTTGSNQLTSTTGDMFVAEDVGRIIVVLGLYAAGEPGAARIASVIDAQTITVTQPTGEAVTAASNSTSILWSPANVCFWSHPTNAQVFSERSVDNKFNQTLSAFHKGDAYAFLEGRQLDFNDFKIEGLIQRDSANYSGSALVLLRNDGNISGQFSTYCSVETNVYNYGIVDSIRYTSCSFNGFEGGAETLMYTQNSESGSVIVDNVQSQFAYVDPETTAFTKNTSRPYAFGTIQIKDDVYDGLGSDKWYTQNGKWIKNISPNDNTINLGSGNGNSDRFGAVRCTQIELGTAPGLILSGSGSPNSGGGTDASSGSLYMRINNAASAAQDRLYVKTTPLGTLDGWESIAFDTTLQVVTDNGEHTTNPIKVGNTEASPNITLNADGSATYEKWILAEGFTGEYIQGKTPADAENSLWNAIQVYDKSNTHVANIYGDGGAFFGEGNITLNADGDIACGYIRSKNDFTGSGVPNGLVAIGGSNVSGIQINQNTTLADNGGLLGLWDWDGTLKIGGTLPDTPNITLNADGAASFGDPSTDLDKSGVQIGSMGSLDIYTDNSESSSHNFRFWNTSSSTDPAIQFSNIGEGKFASTIRSIQTNTTGHFFIGSAAGNNLFEVQSYGQMALRKSDGTATIVLTGSDGVGTLDKVVLPRIAGKDGADNSNQLVIGTTTESSALTAYAGTSSASLTITTPQSGNYSIITVRADEAGDGTLVPKFVVRDTGTVQIGGDITSFPDTNILLEANGTITAQSLSDGTTTRTMADVLATQVHAWGTINKDGSTSGALNVSGASKVQTGVYQITFSDPTNHTTYAVTTSFEIAALSDLDVDFGRTCNVYDKQTTGFKVAVCSTSSSNKVDMAFSFAVLALG